MIITLRTTSGIEVHAPTEKWVAALVTSLDPVRMARLLADMELIGDEQMNMARVVQAVLVTVAATDPDRARKVFALANNKNEAYAIDSKSPQSALTKW